MLSRQALLWMLFFGTWGGAFVSPSFAQAKPNASARSTPPRPFGSIGRDRPFSSIGRRDFSSFRDRPFGSVGTRNRSVPLARPFGSVGSGRPFGSTGGLPGNDPGTDFGIPPRRPATSSRILRGWQPPPPDRDFDSKAESLPHGWSIDFLPRDDLGAVEAPFVEPGILPSASDHRRVLLEAVRRAMQSGSTALAEHLWASVAPARDQEELLLGALLALDRGKVNQAAIAYHRWLARSFPLSPLDPRQYFPSEGHFLSLLESVTRVLRDHPDTPSLLFLDAGLRLTSGDSAGAVASLQTLRQIPLADPLVGELESLAARGL